MCFPIPLRHVESSFLQHTLLCSGLRISVTHPPSRSGSHRKTRSHLLLGIDLPVLVYLLNRNLGFSTMEYLTPFSVNHTCILNSDDCSPSNNGPSTSYRAVCYHEAEVFPKGTLSAVIDKFGGLLIRGDFLQAFPGSPIHFRCKEALKVSYYALMRRWLLPSLLTFRHCLPTLFLTLGNHLGTLLDHQGCFPLNDGP